MPTTVVHSIGTGKDYTTITTWNAACPADLTVANEIWRGELYLAGSPYAEALVGHAITQDATRYVQLTAAAGQSFQDQGRTTPLNPTMTGVAIDATDNYNPALTVYQNVHISRLIVRQHGTNLGLSVSTSCVIQDMLVQMTGASAQPAVQANINTICSNVLAVVGAGFTGVGWKIAGNYGQGTTLIGCAIVRPSDLTPAGTAFSTFTGATANLLHSCLALGFATAADNLTTYSSASNNATNLASGLPGTANQYNVPYSAVTPLTQAASTGTFDFRAIAGTPLIANGYLDSTNAPNDISGQARAASPTIGAWEVVSAPTGHPRLSLLGVG